MKTNAQLAALFDLDVNEIEPPLRCCGCGERKPVDEFYRHASNTTGRQPYCKPCQAQVKREWRQGSAVGRGSTKW